MKIVKLVTVLLFFICGTANSQIYFDPLTAGAMAAQSSVINGQLNQTNDKLTLIQRGQLAVTGQLAFANDLQNQIYKGLSEVSSIVRSLHSIKEIANLSLNIVEDVNKSINMASNNPELLLFAEAGAREFKTRATKLATEVSTFILAGGKNNLMDSGERAKLLNKIVTELMVIRGIAYGVHKSMYWAKMRGFLNSINPYAGYINIDKQVANDIIRNAKYLRK